MNAVKIETTVKTDGELLLSQLPYRKGDRVEAIVLLLDPASPKTNSYSDEAERKREEARKRFLARARASKFRSTEPYPTRDELHERH